MSQAGSPEGAETATRRSASELWWWSGLGGASSGSSGAHRPGGGGLRTIFAAQVTSLAAAAHAGNGPSISPVGSKREGRSVIWMRCCATWRPSTKQRYLLHAHGMKAGGRSSKLAGSFNFITRAPLPRYFLCLPFTAVSPTQLLTPRPWWIFLFALFSISREQSRHHTTLKSPGFWNTSYFMRQPDRGANPAGSSFIQR